MRNPPMTDALIPPTTPAATPSAPPPPAASTSYRLRWPALAVILTGSVMEMLDSTVTSIAGPAIRADLGGGTSLIQWLGVAYTLAMTAGLLVGGRLGDIAGRKRMFLIGAGGFVAGSLLCAIATGPEMMITARAIQGLFGACMIPQGLGMLKEMFPPRELQAAFGAMGPVMGLSAVGGPTLAGWLVDADFLGISWRMIFLINLPIGLAVLVAAITFLPTGQPVSEVRLDLPGAVLASCGALLLLFPLVQGREHGWPAWTFAMMAASVAMFAAFGWHEIRKSRSGGDPLILPSLFRKRAFLGGMATGTIYFAAFSGFGLIFNLHLQLGLGYSPLRAAVAGIPLSIGMVVGMGVVQVVMRHGRKVLYVGAVTMTAGVLALVPMLGSEAGFWRLAPALLITGMGSGLIMGPYFDIVLAGVEPHETGSASGTLTTLQQVGGALGTAVLGTVFFSGLNQGPAAAAHAFWTVAGMIVLTFLAAFLLPRKAREAEPAL
ncbi:MFS transporter [Nonomuraea sp. NPDC004354]